MAEPQPEAAACEGLLAAICASDGAARGVAMSALARWIAAQPGYAFSRTDVLAAQIAEPRFAAARDEVTTFKQLLDLGSPWTHVADAAEAALVAWFAAHPHEAAAHARRLLDLALTTPLGHRRWHRPVSACIPVVVGALRPGEPFPPAYDALLEPWYVKEAANVAALAAMPMARRTAVFDAAIERGLIKRLTPSMLALAVPETLARVAQHEAAEQEKRTAAWAAQEAARAAAPFRFVDPVCVLPGDYDGLDAIGKAQYRAAAGAYVESGKVRDPKDFIRQLKKEELDEGDAELRRWKVMRGDRHVYDLWVMWVENGSFFLAGEATLVPVYIVQGSYQPRNNTAATKQLALDLANSERESLWALPKPKPKPKSKPAKPKPKPKSKPAKPKPAKPKPAKPKPAKPKPKPKS